MLPLSLPLYGHPCERGGRLIAIFLISLGMDALIVYDDLGAHGQAYVNMSRLFPSYKYIAFIILTNTPHGYDTGDLSLQFMPLHMCMDDYWNDLQN
jgi:hypothetical protein